MGPSMIGILFYILTSTSQSFSATPTLPESAQKDAAGQPEVIKEKIGDMKESIINKKAQRLIFNKLLKSEGFESSLPTINISHTNEMSSRYQIFSMTYTIDQDRIYSYYRDDNKAKGLLSKEIPVYKGALAPGKHDLSIEITYKGNDNGVFSYINDYKIVSQVSKPFNLDKGQNLDVQVVGYEKGWALTDFKDRPELKVNFRSANSAKELR